MNDSLLMEIFGAFVYYCGFFGPGTCPIFLKKKPDLESVCINSRDLVNIAMYSFIGNCLTLNQTIDSSSSVLSTLTVAFQDLRRVFSTLLGDTRS